MLAPLAPARCDEEIDQFHAPLTARAGERDLGVVRDERRDEVRWRDHDALLCADDRVIAVLAVDRETACPALEPARRALVAEVPTPIALQQVPADRAHRAELHGGGVAERLAEDRHRLGERLIRLELDERRQRADAYAAALRVRPAAQPVDAGEIDERRRPRKAVLHEADQVRAAGKRRGAVSQKP